MPFFLFNIGIMLLFSQPLVSAFLMIPSRPLHRSSNLFMKSKKHFNQEVAACIKYLPRTPNQELYVNHLANSSVSIVLGIGPAGSGKTMFACQAAVQAMKKGDIDKVILTRPIVSVEDEQLGFLPGSIIQKMDPWTRPIFDTLMEFYSKHEIDTMVRNGVIEISPLAFMRGRTFKNAFIIADEMQNSTPNQMLMLASRIGDGSKMVITGDLLQSDRCQDNGLKDLMEKLEKTRPLDTIKTVKLIADDVQRSAIVRQILDIYSDKVVVADPVIKTEPVKIINIVETPPLPNRSVRVCNDDAALIPAYDMKRLR
jgi:phosphate starvation-inducible PhoH-like protein